MHGAANSVQPHLGTTHFAYASRCGTQHTRESAKHLLVRDHGQKQTKEQTQGEKKGLQIFALGKGTSAGPSAHNSASKDGGFNAPN